MKRPSIYVAVAVVVAVLVAVPVTSWLTVANRLAADSLKTVTAAKAREVALVAKETEARGRTNAIVAHGQCLRLNDGRRRFRTMFGDMVASVSAAGAWRLGSADTAALVARIEARTRVVIPGVDCDRAAPLPSHLTSAERAGLPVPEPIPPLTAAR